MKVFVMVDIEGISGVYTREQVLQEERRFSEGRRFMTADVNACVEGLHDAGVEEIYVCDCHGTSFSLIWDELTPLADYYICGRKMGKRFVGIEDCDAVILLGYHAMAGTEYATLEHSYNSRRIQNLIINGKPVGEIAFDAAIAGEYGKPVIMVSGDDKACEEAKEILPKVTTACVKRGISIFGAMLMPAEKAHKLIYEKSKEAVENYKNCKPYTFNQPIKCEVEFVERTLINHPDSSFVKVISGREVEVFGTTAEEIELLPKGRTLAAFLKRKNLI